MALLKRSTATAPTAGQLVFGVPVRTTKRRRDAFDGLVSVAIRLNRGKRRVWSNPSWRRCAMPKASSVPPRARFCTLSAVTATKPSSVAMTGVEGPGKS